MKLKLLMILMLAISSTWASSLMVSGAYVRATPPGVPNSAAFMMLMNHSSKDISVVAASSSVAKTLELHTHDMVNGVMRMYQVEKIDVEKNGHTMLKPGGFHVMFFGLKKPLIEGETVDLELTLSNGEKVNLEAPVKKVMSGMKMNHGHHH